MGEEKKTGTPVRAQSQKLYLVHRRLNEACLNEYPTKKGGGSREENKQSSIDDECVLCGP